MGRCATCGRIIAVRRTLTGEWLELETRSRPDGVVALVSDNGDPELAGRVAVLGGEHLRNARRDRVALYVAHRCNGARP